MNELIKLIENLSKGVRKVMKTFFYMALLFIIFITTDWIKIVCNSKEILKDVNSVKNAIEKKMTGNGNNETNSTKDNIYNVLNNQNYSFRKHVLRDGETLSDLQQYYRVRLEVLKRINDIEDVRKIRSGQVILIPIIKDY
ncbi:MAG: LysM domain-containing protein [Candidatus Hodarchaeota archaeon]